MSFLEVFILAVGLSMDAFAVAICKGLSVKKCWIKECVIVGLWFGIFQAVMPILGYFLGTSFSGYIESFDHWIAFGLLLIIGGKMIFDSFRKDEKPLNASLGITEMFPFAVATSIDALAVGISFEFFNVNIWISVLIIGVITFILSTFGVKIGNVFGTKHKNKAELTGGIVIILIGVKILLQHLGVINF